MCTCWGPCTLRRSCTPARTWGCDSRVPSNPWGTRMRWDRCTSHHSHTSVNKWASCNSHRTSRHRTSTYRGRCRRSQCCGMSGCIVARHSSLPGNPVCRCIVQEMCRPRWHCMSTWRDRASCSPRRATLQDTRMCRQRYICLHSRISACTQRRLLESYYYRCRQ